MNTPARKFDAKPATREHVPLLIGLMGPSGSGKTFSALRLATGIQAVSGGDIYVIDTEARRALHYADQFKFKHIEFNAPFGSLDYLEALQYCVGQGAGVVVVDSMSHEHEGPGGMIDMHEHELDRLAGNDWAKRERVKLLAWQKPKSDRRRLINGLLQLNANFVFCFRANQALKPMKVNGKTELIQQGFMPTGGDKNPFVYEMTTCCLLLPGAKGVPTWISDNIGEKQMIKSAVQFDQIFADGKPLDETKGRALAEWARGKTSAGNLAVPQTAAPLSSPPKQESPGGAADNHPGDANALTDLDDELAEAAKGGMAELQKAWKAVPKDMQKMLKASLDRRHKPAAQEADRASRSFRALTASDE